MKRNVVLLLLVIVAAFVFAEMNLRNIIIVPQPSGLEVKIWLNKPEGSVYQPGENIEIFFRANKSCYVAIYNIRTDGKITLLFPNKYDTNNYIAPNVNYKIPISTKYSFKVSPPEGKEFIQIIASTGIIPLLQQLKELGTQQQFPILTEDAEKYVSQQLIPYLTGEWSTDITYFYVGRAPRTGTVNLQSVPTGAHVYVDGRYIGRTPQTVTLDEGQHFATFYFDGQVVYEAFTVVAGRTITVTGRLVRTMLDIKSTPSEAQVFLDGVFIGLTPLQIETTPGQHTLLINKEGYVSWQQTFTIREGETKSFNPTLARSTAILRINTNPVGALIYIDGRYVGTAPSGGLAVEVEAGTRSIRASLANYQDATVNVTVNPGETRTVNITLQPIVRTATLRIYSNPIGASIYIDGQYVGVTPSAGLTITVDAGTRTILARLVDYQDATITVTVNPGETRTVTLNLTPIPRTGVLNIFTVPVGASIYIDGRYVGVTTDRGLSVSVDVGIHEVKAIYRDYQDKVISVDVRSGETRTIELVLEPIIRTSSVSINTTPASALVYINGYLKGITPLRLDLEYGKYELVLIKGGYYAEIITLVVDRPTITISRTLRPIQ